MTEEWRARLRGNLPQLCREVQLPELLRHLYADGAISQAEMDHVRSHGSTSADSVERLLLYFIEDKSHFDYRKLVKALKETGHERQAELLEPRTTNSGDRGRAEERQSRTESRLLDTLLMQSFKSFEVELERGGKEAYGPGDTVEGVVLLHTTAGLELSSIAVRFHGRVRTCWSSGKETLSGEEELFNFVSWVWGSEGARPSVLSAGRHRFPFAFKMPGRELPSSLEAGEAWIRYDVSAVVEAPEGRGHEAVAPVNVVGRQDLNQEPSAVKPSQTEESKSLGCLCCASGEISLRVAIPKSGFVPGETIPVSLFAENESNRKITAVSIALVQRSELSAYKPGESYVSQEKAVERKLYSQAHPEEVASHRQATFHMTVPVPPTPPDNLAGVKVIKLSYFLQATASTNKSCSTDLYVDLPVMIGTVPLADAGARGPPRFIEAPALEETEGTSSGGKNARKGKEGETAYAWGSTQFRPRYPTFSFPN